MRLDELDSPRELERWLENRNLLAPGTRLDGDDLRRALRVREDLRALARVNNGDELDPAVFHRLDETVRDARFLLRIDDDGAPRFEPAGPGLEGVFGRLMNCMLRARLEGGWSRFKVCADATCGRAYFDRSRTVTGKWCCRQCGSRMRSTTFRGTERYKNMPRGRLRFYNS